MHRKYASVTRAARIADRDTRTIKDAITRGELLAVPIGRNRRIVDLDDLQKWLGRESGRAQEARTLREPRRNLCR